jgi:hypothetical protein
MGKCFIEIETNRLCDYGCGNNAKYKFQHSNKICCSTHWMKCSTSSNNHSKNMIGKKIHIYTVKIETFELCSYGCGKVAKYKLKNEKICCEDSNNKCVVMRLKNSKHNIGKSHKHIEKDHGNKGRKRSKQSIEKYINTLIKLGKIIPRDLWSDFKIYQSYVRTFTNYSVKENFSNNDLKTVGKCGIIGATQIDHIFSIKEGFLNYVPLYILRIIPWEQNLEKLHKSDISLDELCSKVFNHGAYL